MRDLSQSESEPSYFSKIKDLVKDLGYVLVKSDHDSFMIQPFRPEESWKLRLIEDRWILSVHDTPQISFLPEEAIRFLKFRKYPPSQFQTLAPSSRVNIDFLGL